MRKAQDHRPVLITYPEHEFNPLNVLKEYGFPNENDDFVRLLPSKITNYDTIDELEKRVDSLFDEIDFQISRLTERSDSDATQTVSEMVNVLKSNAPPVKRQQSVIPIKKTLKTFANVEDIDYKRKDRFLPSGVEPLQVLKQVLFLSPFKNYFAKNNNLKVLLHSSLHESILLDTFWWIFLEVFQKQREDTQFLQTRILLAITRRIKDIQQRIERLQKGVFVLHYAETLGKCIYITFLECFPYQITLFEHRFKTLIMMNVCKWTGTIAVAPRVIRKWDFWPLVSHLILPVLQDILRPGLEKSDILFDQTTFDLEIARMRKQDRKFSTDTSRTWGNPLSRSINKPVV